jgi:UDPglucose 6-dehydrogenase
VKICVQGLWHLGSVTASCLAALGHRVVGLDFDVPTVDNLNRARPPVFEPGLEELTRQGLDSGNLVFRSTPTGLDGIDVLWVAYDTPVDDRDEADAEWVLAQVERVLPMLGSHTLVLMSSQLPVGSIRRVEQLAARDCIAPPPQIACCPENLRLGRALEDFMDPDRIVVGIRSNADKQRLRELLAPISQSIEWMSVEAAEMTKHAINAWFATSVAFINEIASICEAVGADAKEVERGLKGELRIGERPYLSPGHPFAGGTLAREIAFLNQVALEHEQPTPLLSSVLPSNAVQRGWVRKTLEACFPDLSKTTVAIWGLTYKPGTDTLRGSAAVELCDWLIGRGTTVHVHDPLVRRLPTHWRTAVRQYQEPAMAAHAAQALVVASPWPAYQAVSVEALMNHASPAGDSERLVVIDPGRFLPNLQAAAARLRYFAVGLPA